MTTNETLFKAVETGNPENVKVALLTEKINSASYYGAKSVIFATEKEHIEILEMLLENGSKVPRPSFWANSYNIATSTLPKAAKSGRVDIVRLLLSYGAAFNKQQLNDVFFDAFALALKSGNLEMIKALINAGANVRAFDPEAMTEAKRIYGEKAGLIFVDSAEEALQGANALIVVTEWKNFWSPNFDLLKKTLKDAVIFDGRNLYQPDLLKKHGIVYYGIGRGLRNLVG
jgi:ankyrin repeat protein